jgi:hypothetical protein
MKESDYIHATNTAKIKVAMNAIGDCLETPTFPKGEMQSLCATLQGLWTDHLDTCDITTDEL